MNCKLCSCEKQKIIYKSKKYFVLKCCRCGLVFTDYKLKQNFYEDDYYSLDNINNSVNDDGLWEREKERIIQIEKFSAPAELLEIGCSFGSFLKVAEERNWRVKGIELSKIASEFGRKKYNLKIISDYLENIKFENKFDVIACYHILEHIDKPIEFIQTINENLKKKGILVIEVPNYNSIKSKLYKEKWRYFTPEIHLFHYTYQTLSLLLRKNGFKILYSEKIGGLNLTGNLKKAGLNKVNNLIMTNYNYFSYLAKFIRKISSKINLSDFIRVYAEKQ